MHSILRISDAASLAIHAAAFLAGNPGKPWTTREIADALRVSENHLSKVLQRMAKAGLVQAQRGPNGGSRLAKSPEEITLLDVYRSVDGELPQGDCLLGNSVCSPGNCIFGGFLRKVREELMDKLANTRLTSIAHLCRREEHNA